MTNLLARLHARAAALRTESDRGAATFDVSLAAILVGVTVVAAATLIGGDASSW